MPLPCEIITTGTTEGWWLPLDLRSRAYPVEDGVVVMGVDAHAWIRGWLSVYGTGLAPVCVLAVLLSDCGQAVELTLPPARIPADIGSMVRIEGGRFRMGAPDDAEKRFPKLRGTGWIAHARPAHWEEVRTFEIGKYEVTAKEFSEFLTDVVSKGEKARVSDYITIDPYSTVIDLGGGVYGGRTGFEYAPAVHVTWEGARRYCAWLSEKTGNRYRLPSEIEWEYTVRGRQGRTFPWGEESPAGRAFVIYYYMNSFYKPESPQVITVGQFPQGATPEGVHDLIGNASEWCANYIYDYSNESIAADAERFKRHLDPEEIVLITGAHRPHVAWRGTDGAGAQSFLLLASWVRLRVVHFSDRPTGRRFSVSFRVLREVP